MATIQSTEIWNRAALEMGGPKPEVGDSALSALLLLHGMAMNGGISHAVEVLSAAEFDSALDGYRFFGLHDVVELLVGAAFADDGGFEKLDEMYGRFIPSDSTLSDAFEAKFAASPLSFAPLE